MKKKPEGEQVSFIHGVVTQNVRAIVEHEEAVRVEFEATPARVVFTIYVALSDVGLVLGTEGATLNAIRRIAWIACKKTNIKADIDIFTDGRR